MIRRLRKRGFTLIELMIVVAIIGILAAIAIPNFIRFQARSKQGEAKSNLKSLFTAQRSFYQEKDRYSNAIREIGFAPERGNRYSYENGGGAAGCTWEDRSVMPATQAPTDCNITVDKAKFDTVPATNPSSSAKYGTVTWKPPTGGASPPVPAASGIAGTCPVCEFVGIAAGNVDNETTGQDAWFIGSIDAELAPNCPVSATAVKVPAGTPENGYNDVNCDT